MLVYPTLKPPISHIQRTICCNPSTHGSQRQGARTPAQVSPKEDERTKRASMSYLWSDIRSSSGSNETHIQKQRTRCKVNLPMLSRSSCN
ncbi:hypothetical protein K474DRAFT_819719 [Panus rudis PR-1116 ss-1]|nr:hypothetical protein K474DRAFT_819719 [Panus rudis PR-1116 ss-1]